MCLKEGFRVKAYNSFIIKWLYSTVKTQCEFTLEENIGPKDIMAKNIYNFHPNC